MPADAVDVMLLAECGVGVASALGAGAERSTEAVTERRRCACDVSECLIAEFGHTAGLMRRPADCVASQMLKAMGPG
eukprot:5684391-Heterocapsa_arctica.AAC.1